MATLLTLLFALLLVSVPANATTVEVTSGSASGYIHADFAGVLTLSNGLSVGGANIFDCIGIFDALSTGHYSAVFTANIFMNNVSLGGPVPGLILDLEFSFPPFTVLELGPFVGAGQVQTEPFTLTGFFTAPGIETINLIGQGTGTVWWFPRDSEQLWCLLYKFRCFHARP